MLFSVENEDEILDRFAGSDDQPIVRDGVLDPSSYWTQERRVLFVLKEANDQTGQWAGDYRCFDQQEAVFQRRWTWPMVCKVAALLTEGLDLRLPYADASALANDKCSRLGVLRRIAVINLKKSAGGPNCNSSLMRKYMTADRLDLLRRQITLYKPSILLAGGDNVMGLLEKELFDTPSRRLDLPNLRGLHYFQLKGEGFVSTAMAIWHPGAREPHAALYEQYKANFAALLNEK